MNDIVLGWKKIARGMARVRKAANDRAPTLEEIQHLIEYPDRRIKPIVNTMVSSGIRIGAWDYLQWKHVSPITNDNGEIVAASLLVYSGDPEEYYSFLTPEASIRLKTGWIFEHLMAKIFWSHGLCAISGRLPTLHMVLTWELPHVQ
jgi:hypothetical protein